MEPARRTIPIHSRGRRDGTDYQLPAMVAYEISGRAGVWGKVGDDELERRKGRIAALAGDGMGV